MSERRQRIRSRPSALNRELACLNRGHARLNRGHDLVGEPPIAYLSGWRMTLAADLLREPDATVGSVARKIGFASPFTFSTAFKRHYGMSPQQYRCGPTDTPAA